MLNSTSEPLRAGKTGLSGPEPIRVLIGVDSVHQSKEGYLKDVAGEGDTNISGSSISSASLIRGDGRSSQSYLYRLRFRKPGARCPAPVFHGVLGALRARHG